ncbi:hypothetical protein OG524_21670 [Streptomyces sp. NBC_01520]|uniref:hypothetical protein n=1 Tax=Streptomyces sp. NBC_01520 TaxID=2903892 RepID=UPI003863F4B5
MTDTTMTPVVAPEATPGPRIPPLEPKPTSAAAAAEVEVGHTPGGWPVVPLAVTGTNATTSLLAAAALVGGPAALAVAATGAVVLGTVAATRKHRGNRKSRKAAGRTSRSSAGSGSAGRTASHGGAGRVPGQARSGNVGAGKSAGRGRGKAVRGAAGSLLGTGKSSGSKNSPGRAGKSSAKHGSAAAAPGKRGSAGAAPGKSPSRAGQVKALRESARKSSPSRAARRSDTAGARRSLADARRGARSAARSASLPGRGPVGRSVGRAAGRVGSARGAAVERSRQARDRRAARQVDALRDDVRKAPVRRAARKALRRSAARFQGRRLLAALLAGALGLVGMVSTPLGRRLGWAWLQYPGRRLYARMTCTAEEQRTRRDDAICAALQEDEAAVDREAAESADRISDTAQRPKRLPSAAAPIICASEGENMSGFRFEEYAAEMESAAGQYDPEDAMEILAMVEGLPAALTSVANVMRVLAERADSEFPLEKAVADGFNDIFGALMSAVAVADDMGPLFRQSHEQDIARHEDPRNGAEAEKGWNV